MTDAWEQRWKDSKGKNVHRLTHTYERILTGVAEHDALYLPILWEGDQPIGALAHIVDWQKKSIYFIISGRDEQRCEPYIGLVLHAHSIRWAIENGLKSYDFCHGDESYKFSFGAKERLLKYLVVRTRSGVNLHGMLDPECAQTVLAKVVDFLNRNRIENAKTGCRQLMELAEKLRPMPD